MSYALDEYELVINNLGIRKFMEIFRFDYYIDFSSQYECRRNHLLYFMWCHFFFFFFIVTTCPYQHKTFTANKNDLVRTEPNVWGARVTVVYFRFRANLRYICHTFIIINFDVFNSDPIYYHPYDLECNLAPATNAQPTWYIIPL